jgi:hypothetical protein
VAVASQHLLISLDVLACDGDTGRVFLLLDFLDPVRPDL